MHVQSWHFDKKVPLGLIVGLAINALCGIWYASKLDSRVSLLEQQIMIVNMETAKMKEASDSSKERLIKVESTLDHILDTLRRLEGRLSGGIQKKGLTY